MNIRQTRTYIHTFDIWEPTDTIGASGPTTRTYSLRQASTACYFQPAAAIMSPSDVGSQEDIAAMTMDRIRFMADDSDVRAIEADWVLVNKSTYTSGTNMPEYGAGWIVMGSPKMVRGTDLRTADEVICFVNRMVELPTGVS